MMTDQELGKEMYRRALEFLDKRFPSGWGGCAVMHTEDGQFLLSVSLESYNGGRRFVHGNRRDVRGAKV